MITHPNIPEWNGLAVPIEHKQPVTTWLHENNQDPLNIITIDSKQHMMVFSKDEALMAFFKLSFHEFLVDL